MFCGLPLEGSLCHCFQSMVKWFHVLVTALMATVLNGASVDVSQSVEVKGFSVKQPAREGLERFIRFVEKELAPKGVNTLILRVDYDYQYRSHPELVRSSALSEVEVKQLVAICRSNGIQLIPQINLLGHQSWATSLGKLLEVYPEFDETPHVILPETYEWPNEDGLYCKSYCPLHPEVHGIVFSLVDEILDAYEADAFHAGMDEVFFIADDQCSRCSGKDPAELFAGEVTKIRNHLAERDAVLWMWGDRLLDGDTTGLGMWEASTNNTHSAIDIIPKDVVICDWHYERAEPTAAYFAIKGFKVLTCAWNKAEVTGAQRENLLRFKEHSNKVLADRNVGMIQTIWSSAEEFMDRYYADKEGEKDDSGQVASFHALFHHLSE